MIKSFTYPVVDLFAGPGGLGEGFSSIVGKRGQPVFKSVVAIERDIHAHQTLRLRHFFHHFQADKVSVEYYQYVAGEISLATLAEKFPKQFTEAGETALRISLGPDSHEEVQKLIQKRLQGCRKWALVGGPPCQAYSLVGRARMKGNPEFEKDERHFLYREYLKIIVDHAPPVFVMENVKGLLSAKVDKQPVIYRILKDLSKPKKAVSDYENGLSYKLYSLTKEGHVTEDIDPADFLVKAEEYGVPQARHRMFIVGVRSDIDVRPRVLEKTEAPTVRQIIGGLPKIRSTISRQKDVFSQWEENLLACAQTPWFKHMMKDGLADVGQQAKIYLRQDMPEYSSSSFYKAPLVMTDWFADPNIRHIPDHQARSHMESDLHRYFFAATFAKVRGRTPKIMDFPEKLLPNHKNVHDPEGDIVFADRFRVQMPDRVSTTITSHISKDGHYFIHYDPLQCRSLTVREAARLQTFPDNYKFEGNRTAQYHQVGNAVPSFLAAKIAKIIQTVLDEMPD